MERFVDMAQLCSSGPHRMEDLGFSGHVKGTGRDPWPLLPMPTAWPRPTGPLSSLSYLPPALELV